MTNNYKYTLDRSSKKYTCPSCNKRTFVRFVDSETQLFLNSNDGRCDRESKCGYFKKPNKNVCITSPVVNPSKRIAQTYHNSKLLQVYYVGHKQNSFITYLLKHFDPIDIKNVIQKYHIGTISNWNGGATVFWQIDENYNIKAGKIMLYNSNTGGRIKKPFNHVSWMHKKLKLNNFELQQCLFGLHCITIQEDYKTICIVESEKTAIIMSIIFPSNIWMATGSKSNFKEQLLQPIKHRKIIAYPDKSEFVKWNAVADELLKKGFNIKCSRLLEGTRLKNGEDLVDLVL
jgi:hypothetical protein